MPVVVAGGPAEWPVLASFDEGQDIRNRRIFIRQGLHGGESLREDAGPMKQLLIEGAYGHEPLAGRVIQPRPQLVVNWCTADKPPI